jgi:hypothetical protein
MPKRPDEIVNVHGWNLPVTKFTPAEVEKAIQSANDLKTETPAQGRVLRDCGKAGFQLLNLVYASIHRRNPTLSLAAVITLIYDFQTLMSVCHRITMLTFRC